ncbi:MAG: hypothetical protein ACXVES_05375, partial [Actinomycetota bacterium]
MRTSDLYIGLMAITAGFSGLVLKLEGAPWSVAIALGSLGAAGLIIMVSRSAGTARVLVVGDPEGGRLNRMEDALDREGFAIQSCVGPARKSCPALHGRPCPVTGHPVAAVIFNPDSYRGAVPPCGSALGIAALTVEAGSAREAAFEGQGAIVGSQA